MCLELSNRRYRLWGVERELIYIERTSVAFAQKVNRLSIRGKYGVAVFSRMVGQIGMFSSLRIVHPYIPGDGRGMMFTPFILEALTVLV